MEEVVVLSYSEILFPLEHEPKIFGRDYWFYLSTKKKQVISTPNKIDALLWFKMSV